MELVAEGLKIEGLAGADTLFGEKDKGAVRLYLLVSPSTNDIDNFQRDILGRGVSLTDDVRTDARVVVVKFGGGVTPPSIIAESVKERFKVLGWQVYKETTSLWIWAAGGFVLGLLAQGKRR